MFLGDLTHQQLLDVHVVSVIFKKLYSTGIDLLCIIIFLSTEIKSGICECPIACDYGEDKQYFN